MKAVFKILTTEHKDWKEFDREFSKAKKVGKVKSFYLKVNKNNN